MDYYFPEGPRSIESEGGQDRLVLPGELSAILKKRIGNVSEEEYQRYLQISSAIKDCSDRYIEGETILKDFRKFEIRYARAVDRRNSKIAFDKFVADQNTTETICTYCTPPAVYHRVKPFTRHLLLKHSEIMDRLTLPDGDGLAACTEKGGKPTGDDGAASSVPELRVVLNDILAPEDDDLTANRALEELYKCDNAVNVDFNFELSLFNDGERNDTATEMTVDEIPESATPIQKSAGAAATIPDPESLPKSAAVATKKVGSKKQKKVASTAKKVAKVAKTPSVATELRGEIKKINCKNDPNAICDLMKLIPKLFVCRKEEKIDYFVYLNKYNEIVEGKADKTKTGLKNFNQFKYFAEKVSASMKSPNDLLNNFTRFSRTDLRKVIVLLMQDKGHTMKKDYLQKCFEENLNLFVIHYVAKIAKNMLLLAKNSKRSLANNCDLAMLQIIESNYGNNNCKLQVSENHYHINNALPSVDRIHKCVFHYLFRDLINKPRNLEELAALMNNKDEGIMELYNSKITQNGFDSLRLVIYRLLNNLTTNICDKIESRNISLEEDPLTWSGFLEMCRPRYYEFASCVVHVLDIWKSENPVTAAAAAEERVRTLKRKRPTKKEYKSAELVEENEDEDERKMMNKKFKAN